MNKYLLRLRRKNNDGFTLVEGGLEDVYLSTLTRARRAVPQKAA